MAERGKPPKLFILLAVLLLVGSLAAAGWYFWPRPAPRPAFAADDLAVVCSGRVDAPSMVISLDPPQAGRGGPRCT